MGVLKDRERKREIEMREDRIGRGEREREEGCCRKERDDIHIVHIATYNECNRMRLNSYIINIRGNEQQVLLGFNHAS